MTKEFVSVRFILEIDGYGCRESQVSVQKKKTLQRKHRDHHALCLRTD